MRDESTIKSVRSARLPRTVVSLGFVSLFTDFSSEAIFPLLPAFLVLLGSSVAFIGLVEGVAELVANTIKYFMGRVVDRRERLKPLVLWGYGVSTIVRPLVAFATSPWHVLLVRATDRIGKGVRSTPRDALIASATDASMRGRAFGFHRAMDHSGAVLGTLFASALLWWLGAADGTITASVAQMRTVFLWAAVPGIFAMMALAATKEPPHPPPSFSASEEIDGLPPLLKRTLLAVTLFAFSNATDAFLVVKAASLGAQTALIPMLWLTLHVVKAATSTAGGRMADHYGKRNALILGWCVYAILWGAIGFVESLPILFLLTALYGTSHGLVEGAEKGLIADFAASRAKGRAFGTYNMLVGFAALLSSVAFGAVWDHWGSAAAFAGSAAFALIAAITLFFLVPNVRAGVAGHDSLRPMDGASPTR